METVTVRMARGDRNTPWGFGVTEAPSRDVVIVNVVGGSLADRAGLRNGDILDELEGLRNLDINATDRLLVTSRDKIELVVHRNGSGGGVARVWKPEITKDLDSNFRVNLEHNGSSVPPKGFNSSALPFNTDPRVKHLQYNSPLGIYSNSSAAEQYAQQTAGVVHADPSVDRARSDQPAYLRSETLRVLKEQEGGYGAHPNPQGLPVCYVCTRPILGVMASAAGHPLHGDCLACSTCGSSLKNVGHHFIDGKFYCDVHARLKRATSTGHEHSVRSTVPAPINSSQHLDMSRRPLSVSPNPSQWASQTNTLNVTATTPRTQGTISPSARGVPSSHSYGADLRPTRAASSIPAPSAPAAAPYRPMSTLAAPAPAPPPPSNPPPGESRIPQSLRSAVSPRRRARLPREWPPQTGLPTHVYWNIAPHNQTHMPIKEDVSLASLVHEIDEAPRESPTPRRLKIIELEPMGPGVRPRMRTQPVRMPDSNRSSATFRHSLTLTIGDRAPSAEPVGKEESVKATVPVDHTVRSEVKENIPTSLPRAQADVRTPAKDLPQSTREHDERIPLQSSKIQQMEQYFHKPAPVQVHHQRTSSYFPELHAPLASEIKKPSPIPPEDRQHYQEPVARDDWKLREAHRNPPYQVASVSAMSSQADEPSKPIVKTNALEERRVAEETGESSELDSVGERKSDGVEEKRLQKKPGRKDPRRLTAIYNPSGEGTSGIAQKEPARDAQPTQQREREPQPVQQREPTVPRTQTIHVTLQPHDDVDSRLRVMSSPRPFVSPDSGRQVEKKQYSYYKVDKATPVRPTELRGLPPLMKGSEVLTPQSEVSSISQKFEARPVRTDWKEASDIVDESDIMTISSRRSDDDGTVAASEMSDSPVRTVRVLEREQEREAGLESFNKDESELVNMQKNGEDTDIDSEEEKERWMLEELMLAKQEEEMLKIGRSIVGKNWGKQDRDERERKEEEIRRKEIEELQERGRVRNIVQDIMSDGEKKSAIQEKRQEGRRAQRDRQQRRNTTQLLEQHQFISETRPQQQVERTEEVSYHASLSRAHSEEQTQYQAWETAPQDETGAPEDVAPRGGRQWEQAPAYQPHPQERKSIQPVPKTTSREPSITDRDDMSESDDWRRRAMQLLEEEGQFGRDMELVSRLNKQLEECRQLDETDRNKAIGCMIKHQQTLEKNQDRLSRLLGSAIEFVRHMDDANDEVQQQTVEVPEEIPAPPMRRHYRDMEQHPGNPEVQARLEEDDILEELSRMQPPLPSRGPVIPEIDYPLDDDAPEYQQENLHRYGESRNRPQTSNYSTLNYKQQQQPRQQYSGNEPVTTVTKTRGRIPETEPLSSVLEELEYIMKPNSADFITRKLRQVQEGASVSTQQSQMRSSFNDSRRSGALQEQPVGGKVPYCEACRQQIRGAFVLAQGLSWCPEHFICANQSCARRLLECGFVEENGQKYCETCFENNIAPRCAKCSRPIVSDCLNALQKKWHPQCFTCAHCSKPFGNSAFYLEQGLPYCEADWNRLFTTKCYQCTYPIEAGDRWVEALGHAYHSNCFNCTRCNINLEGESFYAKNGEPFCKMHA